MSSFLLRDKFDCVDLRISSSQLSTFKSCRLRWKYRYLDKLPTEVGLAASIGTFAHSILEEFFKLPPEERDIEAARALARPLWEEYTKSDQYEPLGLDEEGAKKFRQAAWKAVVGLWDLEDPKKVDVVATEMRFDIEIGGANLVGVADRVSRARRGTLIVVDYKTGKPPLPRYRGDKIDQVLLYGVAISEVMEEDVSDVVLYYLGNEVIRRKTTGSALPDARQKITKSIAEVKAAIEAEEFTPSPGPLCAWCDFVELCEVGQAEVKSRFEAGKVRKDAPALTKLGYQPA